MKKSITGIALALTALLLVSSGCGSKTDKNESVQSKASSDVGIVDKTTSNDATAFAKNKSTSATVATTSDVSSKSEVTSIKENNTSKNKTSSAAPSKKDTSSNSKNTASKLPVEPSTSFEQSGIPSTAKRLPSKTVLNLKTHSPLEIDGNHDAKDEYTCIIKSYEELKNFYQPETLINTNLSSEYKKFIDKYNKDFFKTKSLVFLYKIETSGSRKVKIRDLYIDNETLYIWSVTKPGGNNGIETADMAYWRNFIEVDNAQISNVSTVVGKNTWEYNGKS